MWTLKELYNTLFGATSKDGAADENKKSKMLTIKHSLRSWEEIVCPKTGREQLKSALEEYTDMADANPTLRLFGSLNNGILLFGADVCKNTSIAECVASELNYKLVISDATRILEFSERDKESSIRHVFDQVKQHSPCVFVIQDVDLLCGKSSGCQIVNQFLTELDGNSQNPHLFFVGATSKPWNIDSTFLRPGRLFLVIYVPYLDKNSRQKLLQMQLKNHVLEDDLDLENLADRLEGLTESEIKHIIDEIIICASNQSELSCEESGEINLNEPVVIGETHLEEALLRKPCYLPDDGYKYAAFYERYAPRSAFLDCDKGSNCFDMEDEEDLYS